MGNILAPSILAADFGILGEQIRQVEEGGAEWLHFDVMDGMFVPAISFGMPVLGSVRKTTKLFLDVHLMITEPSRYVEEFARLGADLISFHYEAESDPSGLIDKIHGFGTKAGIVISPGTPAESIEEYLCKADLCLVMTVEPGAGGQEYIPECLEKVRQIRKRIDEAGFSCRLEVDGGVRAENIRVMKDAGADVIVAGSAVFRGNIKENVRELQALIG